MMWAQLVTPPSPAASTAHSLSYPSSSLFHLHLQTNHFNTSRLRLINPHSHLSFAITGRERLYLKCSSLRPAIVRASAEGVTSSDTSLLQQDQDDEKPQPNKEVEESVKVLKNAAKTRKVPKDEVLSALSVIEKAKLDPSKFLETLGGTKSPGRTWMLIFTAEKKLKGGRYFPITAVQRFDAEARRIENGAYFGPLGSLTFEGRFSWKKRILAFIFEVMRIKIGPLNPIEISLGNKDEREPTNTAKDPFFVWFYVDEEIAVARGRSGGTAFWCRCRQVTNA